MTCVLTKDRYSLECWVLTKVILVQSDVMIKQIVMGQTQIIVLDNQLNNFRLKWFDNLRF